VATFEILGSNMRVKDMILHGQSEGKSFYDVMEKGNAFGMITFDQHIIGLYEQGLITQETALGYCSHKGVVGRGIDSIKSARGEATTDIGNLEIDRNYAKSVH
jgi:twitching motility protein PilT